MGKSFSKEDIHSQYTMKGKLGMGSFATVKLAIRKKDKLEVAVKQIKKDNLSEAEMENVMDEVKIMKELDHPNCVHLYEMFDNKHKVYMVMELMSGGELFDRVVQKGTFSEKEAAELLATCVKAIKYIHSLNIVHRDLKPENILYSSNKEDAQIKLTDFGLAKERDHHSQKMNTACGTPGYVAPEVLMGKHYGPGVDMWSIGVILYILLCGFPPFYHENTKELYKQIKGGKYAFPNPYWKNISEDAIDVVKRLLTVDPRLRATPDDVLQHKWLQGTASAENLGTNQIRRLKLMQAKKRLRKGVRSIIATNRFSAAVKQHVTQVRR